MRDFIIKNDSDYEFALYLIDILWDSGSDSIEAGIRDFIINQVEQYENKYYPILS